MKREPLIIAGEVFATKKAATERCRSILWSYKPGHQLGDADFAFMRDLLERHENADDKIGAGVVGMFVMRDGYGGQCFGLHRVDGSKTDFSFMSCLRVKPADADFRAACRRAVVGHVLAFRDHVFDGAKRIECPVTGVWVELHDSHVDHIPPDTFLALLERFVQQEGIEPWAVAILGNEDGATEKHIAAAELRDSWRAFHAKHARLRVVSARANLSDIKKGGR